MEISWVRFRISKRSVRKLKNMLLILRRLWRVAIGQAPMRFRKNGRGILGLTEIVLFRNLNFSLRTVTRLPTPPKRGFGAIVNYEICTTRLLTSLILTKKMG